MWSLTAVLEGQVAGLVPEPGLERLETTAQWCRSYLLQGHPELGRAGPVCPWCPPSVAHGHFYLMHADVKFCDQASVASDLYRIRDQYLQMPPDSGPDAQFKTVVYVMSFTDREPDADELRNWMTSLHTTAKPSFLSRGLMLGEFFPNYSATGVRSDSFKPLQSPVPMFVIRAMVPFDITFLSNRREYAEAYFAKFAGDSAKNISDILNISPKRLAPSKLRSILECLRWYDLQSTSVNGLDIVTGALVKESGRSRLQQILDESRTFRPLVTTIVFQPRSFGREVESGSLKHLEWLWQTGHVLRRAAGIHDFIFRDGDRVVAVISTSNPLEVQRIAQLGESADWTGAVSGLATEAVLNPYAEEWEWDGTEHTSGSDLLNSAYADLALRQSACEAFNVKGFNASL